MKGDVYEKFASKALTYIESTEAFLKEQLPDYFQQVIRFHLAEALFGLLCGVGLMVFGCKLLSKAKEKYANRKDHWDDWHLAYGIPAIFALIMGGAISTKSIHATIKLTFAPKVFIVDYLRGKE